MAVFRLADFILVEMFLAAILGVFMVEFLRDMYDLTVQSHIMVQNHIDQVMWIHIGQIIIGHIVQIIMADVGSIIEWVRPKSLGSNKSILSLALNQAVVESAYDSQERLSGGAVDFRIPSQPEQVVKLFKFWLDPC